MKQIIPCYFATIEALMGFAVAWNNNWIPALPLFFLIFAVCAVWFMNIMHKREAAEWKRRREISEKLNEIERKYEAVCDELDRLQDKPKAAQSNSRPSIQFQNMVVERSEHDDRGSKDPAVTQKAFCDTESSC